MAKGYWIAHVSAEDNANFQSDAYQAYVSGARPAFEEHQCKISGAWWRLRGLRR